MNCQKYIAFQRAANSQLELQPRENPVITKQNSRDVMTGKTEHHGELGSRCHHYDLYEMHQRRDTR